MKLRNKKTEEIKPAEAREDGIYLYDKTTEQWYKYELGLLAKWWEYYEEPKVYYYISDFGAIRECEIGKFPEDEEDRKQIGNYFETEEEADNAVVKLKAWKWLKDKGFRFTGVEDVERTIHFEIPFRAGYGSCEAEVNLEFLFGDEE